MGIISTIFAINPQEAFWGFRGRYEGLVQIIYYFSLTFLSSFLGKKYKKIVIISILLGGVIQCIYAICQIYEVPGIMRMINSSNKIVFLSDGFKIKKEVWATGVLTNPNFFGSYMILCLAYALGLYIDEKQLIKSIIFLGLTGLFLVGLLISNATSAAVGIIVVLVYTLVYCIKNKYFKKLLILSLILISVIFGIKALGKTTLVKDVIKTGEQATEMAKGNIDEKYGTNRLYIWKNTLKIVPPNIIHGVGIDNFYFAFNGKPLYSQNGKVFYDKAHNEYLQILITEGIFCLISYLLLYGYITIKGIKSSFKNKELYFIIPVIGYLVQAFFNISVIEVAPLFFIALGICINTSKNY
ncbi:MAG: O-antigen ligase family protein [Clostridia bacterium]|nr:O-antigen ligase family protein [Clostridia bacterium]